ncbi:STM3941 family protein [[Clostridium] fimetarium]|uniref:Uncharacterized protein n=1 Tax=[Clostridium] fimetarium TaxID=99656 RepID=A0A1I0RYF6_9FIRM|nr:STM3941 family protein [[Clostridium] fimetarium]SEW46610.1 hypothetical protein SAMN05421659_1363 [[Clostridium] fimetarium]
MNEPIIVKQSLSGNILYALGALIMSSLSLCLVILNFSQMEGILGLLSQNIIFYVLSKSIMAFGFLFFLYCFFIIIKKAILGNNILIVDEKGITDNSSIIAFGFIPWADIDKIYIESFMGNDFIELVLNNEDYYIKKINGIKRKAISTNKKMGLQAVCITLNSSGISPYMLFPKIKRIFQQAKKMEIDT